MKFATVISLLGCLLVAAMSFADSADDIGFNPDTQLNRVSSAYIAPENMLFFRLRQPNGVTREFERDYSRPGVLRSVRQWSGMMKDDKVLIRTGPETNGGPAEFIFKKGRLVSFRGKSCETNIAYEALRPTLPECDSPLLASGADLSASDMASKTAAVSRRSAGSKWAKSGRLQFPFPNPNRNGAFYGELFIFLLGGAFCVSSVRVRIALIMVAGFAGIGLVLSGSRGALLGSAIGFVVLCLVQRDVVVELSKSKVVRILLVLAVAAGICWLCLEGTHFWTRGFRGGSSWSNQIRTEIWANAPKMMVDAPGGWGTGGDIVIGRAYLDWYQPLRVVALTGSLISDHLTRLVGLGWSGRWFYSFVWFFIMSSAWLLAKRRRVALPLAMALTFGITAWFNPIFAEKILWIVPLLSLFWFAGEFPFRRVRGYLVCGVVSAVLAGAVLYGLWAYGSAARRDTVRVTCDKGVVKVKSGAPEVWVVDDEGPALGGLLASKDIRLYYQFNPESEGIGYVRSLCKLPKSGIRKLVLGGKSGDAWLRYVTSSEEARREMPDEVVFISPPFPFAAIPPPLFEVTKVRFLVGEFCTWYQAKEYADPPAGVEIIPGCEMYIPGWLDYVL